MKKYRLGVCKGPDCRKAGADRVFSEFQRQVASAGLSSKCQVYRGGCYGLCHIAPTVVVREDTGAKKDPFSREDFQLTLKPGETHYPACDVSKVTRVVQQHLKDEHPVVEYRDAIRNDALRATEPEQAPRVAVPLEPKPA